MNYLFDMFVYMDKELTIFGDNFMISQVSGMMSDGSRIDSVCISLLSRTCQERDQYRRQLYQIM